MENKQHFKPSADMKYGMIALFILLFICILIALIIAFSVVPLSNRFLFLFSLLIPLFVCVYTVYVTFPFNEIFINEDKIVSKKYFSSITIEWDEVIKIYKQDESDADIVDMTDIDEFLNERIKGIYLTTINYENLKQIERNISSS